MLTDHQCIACSKHCVNKSS